MLLEAKQLYKTYQPYKKYGNNLVVNAVSGIDLTIKAGEICAFVGESGSGKSTLCHLLMGIIPVTSGDIFIGGEKIFNSGMRRNRKFYSKIQMVLQDGKSALDPCFTIYDSIAEPIRNLTKLNRLEEKHRIFELMEKMELSFEILKRKSYELSVGQQKRVCIARALAVEPQIIIFDEALSGLDVIVRKNILNLLKKLHKEQNLSYIIVTHSMDVALYIANRIMVMKEGEIVEQVQFSGDTSCFKHSYSHLLLDST